MSNMLNCRGLLRKKCTCFHFRPPKDTPQKIPGTKKFTTFIFLGLSPPQKKIPTKQNAHLLDDMSSSPKNIPLKMAPPMENRYPPEIVIRSLGIGSHSTWCGKCTVLKTRNMEFFMEGLLGCPRKLGSMVSKWVIPLYPTYKSGILGV